MLIEIDRAASPFQLAHGWSHGMYWRAVRQPVRKYGFITMSSLQSAVYIELLAPNARHSVRLLRLCDVGAMPPMYGDGTSRPVLNRTRHLFGATVFRAETPMQWYDTRYGAVHIAADWETVTGYMILGAWHPEAAAELTYRVTHAEFVQHLQPTAEYVCRCIAAAISPVSVRPDPAIVST
jgi:hypothetical protein